ncbi:MAG: hypothetical protein DRQ10_04280 [Candidatus Hydrothermota bacterium]|nr:MAG: hypothetical protein DRQ10_04280 [Candidatus Hydrothermae bacterium]
MKGKKLRNRLILIFAVWFLYYFLNSSIALYKLHKREKMIEEKIAELKALENYYLARSELLKDPKWIEFIARERLGMVMPNDKLVRILVVKEIDDRKKK